MRPCPKTLEIAQLGRLDECINYVGKHQHFKEAPLYLARFRQCQNRAMSLVKIHVVNTLKAATKNVSTQVQNTGPTLSRSRSRSRGLSHGPKIALFHLHTKTLSHTLSLYHTHTLTRSLTPRARSLLWCVLTQVQNTSNGSEQSFTLFYGKFWMHVLVHAPRRYALRGAHAHALTACWVLSGACDPMLCRIHVFRQVPDARAADQDAHAGDRPAGRAQRRLCGAAAGGYCSSRVLRCVLCRVL